MSLAQKYQTSGPNSGNKTLKKSFEDSYLTVRDQDFNRRLSELDQVRNLKDLTLKAEKAEMKVLKYKRLFHQVNDKV